MADLDREGIVREIRESIEVKQRLLTDVTAVAMLETAVKVCVEAYRRGNRILLAGNGGSAADSQHIAAELVSRFYYDRPGLPAIALTTDTSMLTAIGNDYGYERLFARQLEANGRSGDVFVGLSTSGKSPNVIAALRTARSMGIYSIGLTGAAGGVMPELCDLCLRVPSTSTPRIQECHILIGHIVCGLIEAELFPRDA